MHSPTPNTPSSRRRRCTLERPILHQVNEVIVLCVPSEPASAPSSESWPRNLPSSGSAGWPGDFCLQSLAVRAGGQPPPQPHAFIQRVASAGLPAPILHGGPQIPREVPRQRHPPRPRRPPSLPRPLVLALSRSRLLAGMKTIAQSSRAMALLGTRRAIAFQDRGTRRGRDNGRQWKAPPARLHRGCAQGSGWAYAKMFGSYGFRPCRSQTVPKLRIGDRP